MLKYNVKIGNENGKLFLSNTLVVVPDNAKLDRPYASKGHTALSDLRISKDIIVTKKDNFVQLAKHVSTFYYKIKKEAVKIYSNGII